MVESQSATTFVVVLAIFFCGLTPALVCVAADIADGVYSYDQSGCYSGNYSDANVSVVPLADSGHLVLCLSRCLQTSWCKAARYTRASGGCDLASVQLCSSAETPIGERYYRLAPIITTTSTTTVTTTTSTTRATTTQSLSSLSFSSTDLVNGSQTFAGCQDAMSKGITTSGVLYINPSGTDRFPVWCNFTAGEASLTIHRRFSGDLDFVSRTWADYENGFGNLSSEYWLGLRRIYQLTKTGAKLLVYLVGDKDKVFTCSYSNITILPASTNYTLFLSGYVAPSIAGTNAAQNQMTTYINRPFSTKDVDNDLLTTGNCATTRGGWWWDDCNPVYVNINGDYSKATASCIFYQTAAETQGCHLQYISWRIVV